MRLRVLSLAPRHLRHPERQPRDPVKFRKAFARGSLDFARDDGAVNVSSRDCSAFLRNAGLSSAADTAAYNTIPLLWSANRGNQPLACDLVLE
jgi:hypothetical protein